jgi:hypothetical protein
MLGKFGNKTAWLILLLITAAAVAMVFTLIWKNAKRWYRAAPVIIPLSIIFVFAWFARQNHFEWMFNPLETARFARISETDFVTDDEMVLAVKIGDDAVAFPVRQMAYHHVVQETVGGTPITATY